MSIFQTVTLSWGDKNYEIASDNVLSLIAIIEEHIRVVELHDSSRGVPLVKLSRAYAAALNYAGCAEATPELVYESIYKTGGDGPQLALNAIMMLMLPKSVLDDIESKNDLDSDVEKT